MGLFCKSAIAAVVFLALAGRCSASNTQDASTFPGATWAEQVNAAVGALPATGGTVDAQNVCQANISHLADTDVILGSDGKRVRLILGGGGTGNGCIYPLGAHSIVYFGGTDVAGAGIKVPGNYGTLITYTGSGAGVHYGGAPKSTVVYGVYLHNFSITGNGAAGSIGIDMTYALASTLERISTGGSDNGWKFGGTTTCSCYNQIIQVVAGGVTRGGWLSDTANQNQIFGGSVRYSAVNGIGLDIAGGISNQVYSLAGESSPITGHSIAIEAGSIYIPNSNVIENPYLEGTGPILLAVGVGNNSVTGAGGLFGGGSIADKSGNTTNYIHQTGGGGGTTGQAPYIEAIRNGLYFGSDFSAGYNDALALIYGGANGAGLVVKYNGVNSTAYGHVGDAPFEAGELITKGGFASSGLQTRTAIASPTAPTFAVTCLPAAGETCSSTYSYYVVCHDWNGGITLPSAVGMVKGAPDTINPANFVTVKHTILNGCATWDILKANTSTSLVVAARPNAIVTGSMSSYNWSNMTQWQYKDTGQSTSVYTSPSRNTTADVAVPSGAQIRCANGGAIAITNGSLACP